MKTRWLRHMRRAIKADGQNYSCESLSQNILSCAEMTVNGYVKDGGFSRGMGSREAALFDGYTPKTVIGAHYCAAQDTYYVMQSGALMKLAADDEYFAFKSTPYTDSPFFFDEHDTSGYRAVMVSGQKARVLTGDGYEDDTLAYPLACGVTHHGRLFAVDYDDAFKIRWSGMDGFNDWQDDINSSGYVCLTSALGAVKSLISYGSFVVALRGHGLTAMTAFGSPENFKVDDKNLLTPPVYGGTAAICSGDLYFCTEGGVYRFDGTDINRVNAPMSEYVTSPTRAVSRGSRYFVGCVNAYDGSNAVYCYDADEKVGYFIDCAADFFCSGKKFIALAPESVNFIEQSDGYLSTLKTREIDFGRAGLKTLTYLSFKADGEVTVTISCGSLSRKFCGSGGVYRVGLRGEKFVVTLNAAGSVYEATVYAEA